jgi:pimeloyl-ACP methyl ester carboxylesterase
VIAVDLPRTTAGDKKSMAAAVHGLVQALGLTSVHIAGHDIGAMVAFSFAANHPAATKTVTIMDVPHPDESLYQLPLLMPPGTVYPWWFAFNQVQGLPEQLLAGRSRYMVDYLCSLLLVDIHQDIEDQKAYGTITAPMLGIASLASPYLEYALTARGSDVRVVTIPTSGHFVPEEAPAEVTDALVALIG